MLCLLWPCGSQSAPDLQYTVTILLSVGHGAMHCLHTSLDSLRYCSCCCHDSFRVWHIPEDSPQQESLSHSFWSHIREHTAPFWMMR